MEKLIGEEIKSLQMLLFRRVVKETQSGKYKDLQLSGMNMFVLRLLYDEKKREIFQKDIQKRTASSKSSLSKVLSVMEQKGLITRNDVTDGRFNKIEITEKGCEVVEYMRDAFIENDRIVSKGITEENMKIFFDCIDKMKKNLSED